MCKKLSYNGKRIDPCLSKDLKHINSWRNGLFKSLLSCCGHSKYEKTVVVQNNSNGAVFEWFSGIKLPQIYKNGKKRKRYYKKDKKGYYYIPEVIGHLSD